MKVCDRIREGGNEHDRHRRHWYLDFDDEFVLMGHDGPGHLAIAEGRPVARALKLYHGKAGAGLSIEMKVRLGPVTILRVTQTADGRLKLIAAEGESIAEPTFRIGNTNSRIRFAAAPTAFFDAWCAEGPTHHVALGVHRPDACTFADRVAFTTSGQVRERQPIAVARAEQVRLPQEPISCA